MALFVALGLPTPARLAPTATPRHWALRLCDCAWASGLGLVSSKASWCYEHFLARDPPRSQILFGALSARYRGLLFSAFSAGYTAGARTPLPHGPAQQPSALSLVLSKEKIALVSFELLVRSLIDPSTYAQKESLSVNSWPADLFDFIKKFMNLKKIIKLQKFVSLKKVHKIAKSSWIWKGSQNLEKRSWIWKQFADLESVRKFEKVHKIWENFVNLKKVQKNRRKFMAFKKLTHLKKQKEKLENRAKTVLGKTERKKLSKPSKPMTKKKLTWAGPFDP